MVDPIAVLALIISLASAIFIGIKEGTRLVVDFRESETTIERKKQIDTNLNKELKQMLLDFISSNKSEKEKVEEVELLGRYSYLARSITEDILDNITFTVKSMLKWFLISCVSLAIVVAVAVAIVFPSGISQLSSLIVLAIYLAIFPFVGFYRTFQRYGQHQILRDAFRKLYEKPELKNCDEIAEELEEKNLF